MGEKEKLTNIQGVYALLKRILELSKSFTKLYIHCVWSTKNRSQILNNNVREKLFAHIRDNCIKKDITILEINGYTDHVHLLIDLNPTMPVAEAVNLIKGESSHWINENKLFPGHFSWQKRYSAFSVSHSVKGKVINYIRNQENHHRTMSYMDEIKKFYQEFGMEFKEEYLV